MLNQVSSDQGHLMHRLTQHKAVCTPSLSAHAQPLMLTVLEMVEIMEIGVFEFQLTFLQGDIAYTKDI